MPTPQTGEYPANWPEIAGRVKDAAGWVCVRGSCKHPHDPASGYTLTVHHLDGNKSNCAWWNLAALCQRCHLTIQGKVIMNRVWIFEHSTWFLPYVGGYYANIFSHDLTATFLQEWPRCHDYDESFERIPVEYAKHHAETFIQYGRGLLTVEEVIDEILKNKCLPTQSPVSA